MEIKRVSNKTLVGTAPELIRHYIELRGIGIVDVRRIFGMGSVKETEKIDLVINFEAWEQGKMYERLGLDTEYAEILGLKIPSITIPVKPGRNLAVVIEIAAMNNRQKKMGYNTALEFSKKMMNNGMFISNDTYLNNFESRISIITGPNMAGKSTYMRQTALIVLMAQIGSFVPAASANIGICDRIFTRVGASDDLASGQSTFMVEMSEVANILRNATKNSLLILDEIGRGTSTYDGLSIAWAVVEYISNSELLGAKTLFATHYHELTELEGKLSSVNNYCIAVKEDGDDIVFLRKIVKGGADRSYGIQVAKLAGVPDIVINRANEICNQLIDTDITTKLKDIKITNDFHKSASDTQMSFLANPEESAILEEIKNADLSNMTPMKALLYLNELQERIR